MRFQKLVQCECSLSVIIARKESKGMFCLLFHPFLQVFVGAFRRKSPISTGKNGR